MSNESYVDNLLYSTNINQIMQKRKKNVCQNKKAIQLEYTVKWKEVLFKWIHSKYENSLTSRFTEIKDKGFIGITKYIK